MTNQYVTTIKKRKSNKDNTPHSILAKQHFEQNSSKFINDEKKTPGNGMCGLITTAFHKVILMSEKKYWRNLYFT